MNDSQILTQEGYDKLLLEKQLLEKEKRPEAVERLKKAREMGDLSENSEYVAAKESLSFIDGRLAELEEILKKAQIVGAHEKKDTVEIGDTVEVEIDGSRETFKIVGELEADIAEKKLSVKSPIGLALLGKKKGESIRAKVPVGEIVYKIVDIR